MLRNVTQIGKIGPSHPATPPAACHSAEIQINSLIPKTKLASSVQFYSQPNLAPHAQTRTILHKNAEFRKTNDANPNRPLAPSLPLPTQINRSDARLRVTASPSPLTRTRRPSSVTACISSCSFYKLFTPANFIPRGPSRTL